MVFFAKSCTGYVAVAEDFILFNGTVKLYSGIYYNDPLLELHISMPNRCYNINCANIDNKTASAKWSGLPTTGWAGKAFITFYAGQDCTGSKSSSLLPHNGGIREFVLPNLKDSVSSFMVRSESRIRRHGWTGVDVKGGAVYEPDNDKSSVNDAASDWQGHDVDTN
ncbi:hypothetical protein V7S43_005772 [Phytophthora oleae]|uniref:Glycosyl hydrolase family 81 N-terminal domain-containing protein n=1 Tax=Phytophthora oleae TaxID=2107226 RepID=A0ABD3FSW8_9STRA